jgi:hypothetical protein
MSKRIGFVILSHNNPHQLRRLVRCLQRIYDNPPIAIHHDLGQSPLRPDDFPPNAEFVVPHTPTRWGQFSVVIAAIRAIELLYRNATPDWFFLLSGADYPTMPAEKVLGELASSTADALLDYRRVPSLSDASHKHLFRIRLSRYFIEVGTWRFDQPYPPPDNPELEHFEVSNNLVLAWRRYIGIHAMVPVIRSGPRIGRYTLYLPFEDWSRPFTDDFKCFYGDHWFAGNHKVVEILLNPTDKHMKLRRHLRFRPSAEECYYHTILGNDAGLKISRATRRFADWSQSAGGLLGGAHPKVLAINDLPTIISSKSYFARKFAPDSPVLDEIDKLLS